jgi:hypothetical protein
LATATIRWRSCSESVLAGSRPGAACWRASAL